MKTLYPSISILFAFVLLNLQGKTQVISENFNAGLPSAWTQSPTATWTLSSNLGTSGSGCVFTQEVGSNTLVTTLRTPTLNLSSVTNLTVSFKAAVVTNNFINPNVALYYDSGSGPQFMARWGSGFSPNTTYTINFTSDYTPPLDAQNVNFVNCTQTVSPISGTVVTFIFDAEMINGGYVVLDDIVITGSTSVATGLENNAQPTSIIVFPNPAINKKVILEGRNIKTVFVSDNLGKVIIVEFGEISDDQVEVDLSKLENGIYYLTAITVDNISIHKKIILE